MRLRSAAAVTICCALTAPANAAQREMTVFSDGALVEIEAQAQKKVVEVPLPGQPRDTGLRVKPLDRSTVEQVQLLPGRLPDRQQRELEQLIEQRERLNDRMKALDTKEGIFKAAAKSQSSKTPRKTKTNPDPLTSVRQGTDFAIAQLEAVYTARRRTEQELKRVNQRIEQLGQSTAAGPVARIFLNTPNGRVKISAVLGAPVWRPRYELRLDNSATAQLVQLAEVDGAPAGFLVRLSPAALADGQQQQAIPLASAKGTRLTAWQLPVTQRQVVVGPLSSYRISLTNATGRPLPAGEAAVYQQGEFLGTTTLPAAAPDATFIVSSQPEQAVTHEP